MENFVASTGELSNTRLTIKTIHEGVVIHASTTNPTMPAAPSKWIELVDDGSGWCEVIMRYDQGNTSAAVGEIGSGSYLFKLPGGYIFDTSIHPVNSNGNYGLAAQCIIPGSSGAARNSSNTQIMNVVPYNNTYFKLHDAGQGVYNSLPYVRAAVASTFYSLDHTNLMFTASFRFKKG